MASFTYFDEMDSSVMDSSVMDFMSFDQGLVSSPPLEDTLTLPGSEFPVALTGYDDMSIPFSQPQPSYFAPSPVPTFTPGSPALSQMSAGNTTDSSLGRVQKTRSKSRFDPIGSPTMRTSAKVRKLTTSSNTSEEDEVEAARESNRLQRIGSEQKRRDQLRTGYDFLREILPQTSSKMSKVVILERACETIKSLSIQNKDLQNQIRKLDDELARTRNINELLQHRLAGSRPVVVGQMPPL